MPKFVAILIGFENPIPSGGNGFTSHIDADARRGGNRMLLHSLEAGGTVSIF